MQPETQSVVAVYNSVLEAQIDQSLLENAGIWSVIRNEYMSSIYPIGAMPAELVVRTQDLQQARELLKRKE